MKELPVNDIDSRSVKGKTAREMRIRKYNFDLESLQSVNKLSIKAKSIFLGRSFVAYGKLRISCDDPFLVNVNINKIFSTNDNCQYSVTSRPPVNSTTLIAFKVRFKNGKSEKF